VNRAALRTYRLTLAYDGTGLVGWQRQAAGVSVQALLEEALATLEGSPVPVAGAGRTDAGVHAIGQVASCSLRRPFDPGVLRRALNALLPPAVRVLRVGESEPGFHARFAARGKIYQYALATGDVLGPFEYRYVWHVPRRLDAAAMAEAAALLEGHHDFAAFQSAGSRVATTTRSVVRSGFRPAEPGEPLWAPPSLAAPEAASPRWIYEIAGDGFLRQMVRAIVGSLVEVGTGRRSPADLARILASCDRRQAGPTAPAHGLCLVAVLYDETWRGCYD